MATVPTKKARIVNKYDTLENWNKAVNFTPLPGEIIVYATDEEHEDIRIKVGDGVNGVNDLEFVNDYITNIKVDEICSKE
jgi:hypothetical protein